MATKSRNKLVQLRTNQDILRRERESRNPKVHFHVNEEGSLTLKLDKATAIRTAQKMLAAADKLGQELSAMSESDKAPGRMSAGVEIFVWVGPTNELYMLEVASAVTRHGH